MKKIFIVLLFTSKMLIAQQLKIKQLLCDYRINPIGVDTKTPALSWQLNSTGFNVKQTSYQILVSDDSVLLVQGVANIWDSKKIVSEASMQHLYHGKSLMSAKKYFWKVIVTDNKHNTAQSTINSWQMGLLQPSDWEGAKWIAYEKIPDTNKIIPLVHLNGKKAWGKRLDILPLFRKEFHSVKKIKSATAFISGLGHFEFFMNGQKVGNNYLDPGWTNYSKEALYVSFDVTNMLLSGTNALGVSLGNGFYYIPSERYRKATGGYGFPKMICRLFIQYLDGSTQNIVSDGSWKTEQSPVIYSSIYGGEDYDATKEQMGWKRASFNDASWKNSIIVDGPALHAQTAEPVGILQSFDPVKTTNLKSGVQVFDLGQNMSGIPEISVKGKRGDTIKIIPSELLHPDGSANQDATGKQHYYQYILKGDGIETWHPSFTYYGFRYLQIEKAVMPLAANPSNLPQLIGVKGLHISSQAKRIGQFSSSNQLFNQTDKLIDWSIKSNMVSVFTDCPHREKLGWLEQTYLVGSSVKYAYDIATLMRKTVTDIANSQTAEGLIPEIAPEFIKFDEPFRDSPEWGAAGVLLPWFMYEWYGDIAILEQSYPVMNRYIQYLHAKDSSGILMQGLGDWFDIGPARPGFSQHTPQGLTATATYYYIVSKMKNIASITGHKNDALFFTDLAATIKKSFNQKFYNSVANIYGTGSQTANAIALYTGLVPDQEKEKVLNKFIESIKSNNNALTAGDIGYKYVLKVLTDAGRSDVIFDMNNRSDVPGYGYQIAAGATALTESWQALPSVSNNHFMLGHIMEWFYEGLAGIGQLPGSTAYKHIRIQPKVVGNITSAAASYQSMYGTISSAWNKTSTHFVLDLTIPVNTDAEIILPVTASMHIFQNGILKNPVIVNGNAIVHVGSGIYKFEVK